MNANKLQAYSDEIIIHFDVTQVFGEYIPIVARYFSTIVKTPFFQSK